MSISCIGCGSNSIKVVIDLGQQPPSNRFLAHLEEDCETHPLRFGYCPSCGLSQLLNPMAIDVVRSRFPWITYNEPEGHLDNLVERLFEMTGITTDGRIVGVTYKDDSTLVRFNRNGIADTYRLDQIDDLGITDQLSSLESIQDALTQKCAETLAGKIGRADIVLVRHILEHAHSPLQLLEACESLAKPGGWIVFEVPDCRKVMGGHDHCFIWEEHISYFSPETLRTFLECAGFSDVGINIYPYPMEDSLVAIVRNVRTTPKKPHVSNSEIGRVEYFGASFAKRSASMKQHLQSLQLQGIRVALFGAGHLAAKFINFYGLAPFLCSVIDDNPNKQKLLMPGSGLPVINSRSLDEGNVGLCLLTLNPESEQKVLAAKASYLDGGGKFRSIFSASPNSIDLDQHDDRA